MRILVVEDEQKTADYLQQGLNESGYVVDCAANGIDGLHLAGQHAYELVILDVNLPGKDGWQVLEELRRNGTQRVMMLTARGRLADKIKGLDMGADDGQVEIVVADHQVHQRVRAGADGMGVQAQGQAVLDLFHLAFQVFSREFFQLMGEGQVGQGRQQQHQTRAHQADRQAQAHRQAAGLHGRASST